jgi:uncharacterized LabA/DUF88 family protein
VPDERVAVFIDGSNLYHGLKQRYGRAGVDLGELVSRLVRDRCLVRTYYYIATVDRSMSPERATGQQRFLERLQELPYFDVRLGRLERRGQADTSERTPLYVEKGVDVALVTDMVVLAYRNAYDTAVVVSGDGDFARAVEAVKDLGKHVENAQPGRDYHLRTMCDVFVELDDELLEGCWL